MDRLAAAQLPVAVLQVQVQQAQRPVVVVLLPAALQGQRALEWVGLQDKMPLQMQLMD